MPREIFSLSDLIALWLTTFLDMLSYVAQVTQHTEPKKCKHKFLKSVSQKNIYSHLAGFDHEGDTGEISFF
jgi:hypothetical protein